MRKGIDLSTHNQVTDWEKVKQEVDFIMLRAGYGNNNIDEKFVPYATACTDQGIPMGLYWFSYAYTPEMAKKEAQYCIQQAKKYPVVYPIAFDFEYDSEGYAQRKGVAINKTLVMDMTHVFCKEVKEAGYIPVVYTNKDYAGRYFDLEKLKKEGYGIWYAYYNKICDRDDITIWQHTDKGNIPGIIGSVDVNISYVDYVDKSGWVKEADYWKYRESDGTFCKDCWKLINGIWYHFDSNGIMQTGWIQDKEKWYYLKSSGAMASDELLTIESPIHGKELYAFATDGHMLRTNDRGAAV